jgi:hypothetical protein
MFSEKCQLQGRNGIKQLDRVGPYVIIANRQLYETGQSSRYTLIHEMESQVHSVHGSHLSAVEFAQKHGKAW